MTKVDVGYKCKKCGKLYHEDQEKIPRFCVRCSCDLKEAPYKIMVNGKIVKLSGDFTENVKKIKMKKTFFSWKEIDEESNNNSDMLRIDVYDSIKEESNKENSGYDDILANYKNNISEKEKNRIYEEAMKEVYYSLSAHVETSQLIDINQDIAFIFGYIFQGIQINQPLSEFEYFGSKYNRIQFMLRAKATDNGKLLMNVGKLICSEIYVNHLKSNYQKNKNYYLGEDWLRGLSEISNMGYHNKVVFDRHNKIPYEVFLYENSSKYAYIAGILAGRGLDYSIDLRYMKEMTINNLTDESMKQLEILMNSLGIDANVHITYKDKYLSFFPDYTLADTTKHLRDKIILSDGFGKVIEKLLFI